MTVVEIDGYGYIGYLSIPACDLDLPVMSEWDYARLKIAPCRYTGSTKTDDLVIAAHNYVRHFKSLWNIPVGETVYFTDMDGVRHTYAVAAGEYALTLFTCNNGGTARVTVRCEKKE